MTALALIAAERQRQVEKGYTPEHDDRHAKGELAQAAACYALVARPGLPAAAQRALVFAWWPWDDILDWEPSDDPVRDLVRAGALIVAELERLQRQRGEA